MTHWWSLFNKLPLILLFSLLAGAHAWAAVAPDPTAYQTKATDLEKLRAQIEALRANLNEVQGQHKAVREQLHAIEQDIDKLSRNLGERDSELQKQTQRLAELEVAKQAQQGDLAKQRRALGEQLRASYIIGRQEYLKVLLNQQNPATIGRGLIYYKYFNRAKTQGIARLTTQLAQLDSLEQAVRRQVAEVENLRAAQAEAKQALETSQATRRALLAQLDTEIQNKDQELQRLVEDERQLRELLPKLQQALAAIPAEPGDHEPFDRLKGKLSWPTRGPIRNAYGSSRMAGAMKWQGVTIGAPAGQEVRAVSQGRVAFADWLRGFGLLLIIDHGNGYMSLYGQNQSLAKRTGDWVQGGDIIANVGSSEAGGGPGLYFEIRHQGEPSNPGLWCKKDG
ncbi:MAG: peptidoglycan DD-metalloendopeptidase family protein [Gammaproteobacteria bacterium]